MDERRLASLKHNIARLPRVRLTYLPTPLEPMPRLTSLLGGPSLWVKRDDQTGLAFGGNKSRMFEFVIAEAKAQGADLVLAGAAVQSNYSRQLAAACARVGMECHLFLRQIRKSDKEIQGNCLLDYLLGAHVEILENCANWIEQAKVIQQRALELRRTGRNVYVARVGDESHLGLYAAAYVEAAIELVEQCKTQGLPMDELWVCSCDCTQAGLVLGFKHIGYPVRVVGVSPVPAPLTNIEESFPESISAAANQAAEILGIETRVAPEDIINFSEYVGPGYGIPDKRCIEALLTAARSEGLILDPVYSGKAFGALLEHIQKKQIARNRNVVFLHTGGMPAVFAYQDMLLSDAKLPPSSLAI